MNDITVQLSYGAEKETTTTQRHPLGTLGVLPDGRKFRYAFSGEAIGAGQVVMQKMGVANHDMDLVVPAAIAVGAMTMTVTLGATAATVDQYADGYIYVNDGAGEGHIYRIKSAGTGGGGHAAVSSGGAITVNLADDGGVDEALDTNSLCGLMENPYKDCEIWDADDVDGPVLGVAPCEVANDRYFWCQTSGNAAVLIDNTTVVLGSGVGPSVATDGAATLFDTSGAADRQSIGTVALIVAVSTDYGIVKLTIE